MVVSKVLEDKQVDNDVSFEINPGSRQVLENLTAQGDILPLIKAGARIHQAGCLGCIGMGQAPATGTISLRTFPRNFPGRSGTKGDQVYLCSPEVAVAAVDSTEKEHGIGGPDVYTQDEAAELAFEVLGKEPKLTHIPMGLMRFGVKIVRLLNAQFGDLFDFIVTAGEIDGVAPSGGKRTLRAHFEELAKQ